MRRLVLYNPSARGAQRGHIRQRITSALTGAGLQYEWATSHTPQQATELARQAARQGFDQVIAAGGDGMANAVLNGLVGSETALGIIPLGTANALATNLGLPPRDIGAAVAAVGQGRTRRIDLGLIDGRYFGAMAGVGLDAQVAAEVANRWKRPLGKVAFIGQLLSTVSHHQPYRFELEVEGKPWANIPERLWAVVICNFPLYTWRLRFVPEAQPDDGRLDVVAFHGCSHWRLLQLAARCFLLGRGVGRNPHVTTTSAQHLRISSEPPCSWQVDGEVAGQTPVVVEVAAQALDIIVSP